MPSDSFPDKSNEFFKVEEPLILINVRRTYGPEGRDAYDAYHAVRCEWKISVNKVVNYNLVLAHYQGQVVGAFRPREWLPATRDNFPGRLNHDTPGRWGFVGEPAGPEIRSLYVGKWVPDRYRPQGAANPIRFCDPDPSH